MLQDGDRNSSYVHRVVNVKKANNITRALEINSNMCRDKNLIKEHISYFYTELLSCNNDSTKNLEIMEDIVPKLVSF